MATWSFIITIGATPHDITSLVDIRSILRDRRLHSELKANVDKLSFRMLLDPTIYPLILAAPTVEIAVTRDAAAYFSGYVSPNYKTPIRNGQKYITITAEDPSLLGLGKTITEPIVHAGYAVCNSAAPAASLVHVLAAAAGVSVASSVPTISAVIPLLCVLPDDKATYAKILDELLFQHRHVRSFNESGELEIYPVVNTGDVTTTATLTTEAGSQNIIGELVQNKSPREYDDIRVSYKKVELKTGITVFQDTSGGTAANSCEITLAPYGDANKKDYYPLTSDAGEVFSGWNSPDGYDILAVVSPVFDEAHETGISALAPLTNYYKKFSYAFRNTDAVNAKKITRLKVTGNAYVVVAKNVARSDIAAGKELLEISAEYLFDEATAADLAKALAQYYKYSSLTFEAKSKIALTKGQYVLVEDPTYSGISAACRVIGIIDQEKMPGIYTYTLEAVSDFVAAGIIIEGQSEPLDDSGNNAESNAAMREIWYSNAPPTNNVTGLAFDSENNADGSVDVVASWEYEQGAVSADGFLVYYKSEPDTPDPIVLSSDPAAFISASPTATAYSHVLPALAARYGGAGAVARHYRFAVVAVGARAGGMIPAAAGVVEAAGWVDKTFAPAISFEDESGFVEIKDGGLYAWKGSGVDRRYGRVSSDGVDLVDAPDTTPSSPEVLAARIGRLGVGGPAILDGDWQANIESPWSDAIPVNSAVTGEFDIIRVSPSEVRAAYRRTSDNYIVEKVKTAGVWGSEAVVHAAAASRPAYGKRRTGEIHLAFKVASDGRVYEKIRSGGSWGSAIPVSDSTADNPAYVKRNNGEFRIAYDTPASGLIERVLGETAWGDESVIYSGAGLYPSYIERNNGELRISFYTAAYGLLEQIWDDLTDGWDDYSVITTGVSYKSSYIEDINAELRIAYYKSGYLKESFWDGSAWGTGINVAYQATEPRYIQNEDGSFTLAYIRSPDYYLVERTLQRYAQIGAGIIASGGDATNGYWDAWGNGRLECYGVTPELTGGTGYTISFPMPAAYAFKAVRCIFGNPIYDTYSISYPLYRNFPYNATLSGFTVYGAGSEIQWHAIGTWK